MPTSITNVEAAAVHPPVAAPESTNSVPPDISPNIEHIITEDGASVDSVFSEKQQRLLTEPLYSSWRSDRPFVAMANVGLFFAPKQPPYVPDALLSLDVRIPEDVHPKANRSYFVWEYGKPPDVVIEIVSNKEGGEDVDKLAGYARIGVAYYVIYDPEQHLGDAALRVFQISGKKYELLAGGATQEYPLPGIDLGLVLWRGEFEGYADVWLRWTDSTGALIPTGAELAEMERQRADAEQQRADAERLRADAEQLRADSERNRADRLAEQLRSSGIQPDQ